MLSKHGLDAIRFGSHHDNVLDDTRTLVSVDYVDLFSDEDLSN